MQLLRRVPRITAAVLCMAVLCTGCQVTANKPETRVKELRKLYQTMESLHATADITADYGERIYQYSVAIEGDVSSGSMTVQSPENIAGTVLQWSDGTTSLSYDSVTLETGDLTDSGLSPADAMPVVLAACRGGLLLECGEELLDGETVLFAKLENPNQQQSAVSCWFSAEDETLKRAELEDNGRRVITLDFSSFELSFEPFEGAKSD